MPDNLIKIRKYQGIYYLESKKKRFQGRPDRCFYVTYKNQKKLVREKVGWLSEGYNAQLADQIRANRVSNLRHGKELPNRKKREPTFAEAWKRYDAWLDRIQNLSTIFYVYRPPTLTPPICKRSSINVVNFLNFFGF